MSHSAMYSLAHCQLVGDVASGALWMPMGNLKLAFRSDFPVKGRLHTYSFPTIYRQAQKRKYEEFPMSGGRKLPEEERESAFCLTTTGQGETFW